VVAAGHPLRLDGGSAVFVERLGRLTLLNEFFTQEEIERARRYHRPLRWIQLAEMALALLVPLALALASVDDALSLTWWLEVLVLTALVLGATTLARLPLAVLRFRHDRGWGFSTQTVRGWGADRLKALVIATVLTGAAFIGLVGAARAFPRWWPLIAGVGAAVLVALLTFVAPVVVEPVFNRFRPLGDERLADELRALADRAGVPIRKVLVADASRRTTKSNAYVSGLGRTRRVVLWDTLLERGGTGELKAVVAHELGHRRFRHVAWVTLLAMTGTAGSLLVLWALVSDPGDPGIVPFAVFLFTALELASIPFGAALSRRFERAADRFSLELTDDPEAYERLHVDLARENLADLDPPRAFYLALHSHPTPPERIAAGRAWKRENRPRV
jgi:Zn-dependent protease with chaperone function